MNSEKLHTVCATYIFDMTKLSQWRTGQQLRRVGGRRKVGVVIKGNMRDLYGNGNVLYLECVNVKILAAIWYYSFARYDYWGKLNKGNIESLSQKKCFLSDQLEGNRKR